MYIKNIRIKNFRSIWDEEINADNLTILAWWNDAWKSNYLKALNLFFNWETDFDVPFNFQTDLNKFANFWENKAKEIEITVEFMPPDYNFPQLNGFPEPKLKWRKVWRKNWLQKEDDFIIDSKKHFTFDEYKEALKREGKSFRSKIPEWMRNIRYRYIPAIKSNDYFSALLRELYKILSEANVAWIQSASKGLITTINTDTGGFLAWVQNYLWVKSEIALPQDLWWLFATLDILTAHFGTKIPMNSRWDGIKTRHIPSLIKSFAEMVNKNRVNWSPKINTIWGYEEPENNIEMLRAFDLANEFMEYTGKDIQVFLTTHSPAFYNLITENKKWGVKGYYIEQDNGHFSKSQIIEDTEDLDDKMGILHIITPHVRAAKNEIENLKSIQAKRDSEITSLEENLKNLKPQKILIIEDSRKSTINLWKKWMGDIGEDDVTVLSSEGWNKFDVETWVIHIQKIDKDYKPMLFRELDRDWYTAEQIQIIEEYYKKKISDKWFVGKYEFKVLPVCEIENFAIRDDFILPDDLDDIKSHLRLTLNSHFCEMRKWPNWSDWPKEKIWVTFNDNDHLKLAEKCITEAKLNARKYLPGKEILPTAIQILEKQKISKLDGDLKSYLAEIKKFFNA